MAPRERIPCPCFGLEALCEECGGLGWYWSDSEPVRVDSRLVVFASLFAMLVLAGLGIKRAQAAMNLDQVPCFADCCVAKNYPVQDAGAPAYGVE